MEAGYMIFGMKHKRRLKKYERSKAGTTWRFGGISNHYTLWQQYIEHVTSEQFIRCSQSDAGNQNRSIHGSVTTHTGNSVSFAAYAKRMVRLI